VGSKRAGRTIRGEDLARFVEDLFEHSPEVGAILQRILQALVQLGNGMDSRKPMVWSDMEYEPETYNPDGTTREPDVVAVDEDLLAHYEHLIGIRNRHEALRVGAYRTLMADEGGDVFAFERTHGSERIVVALNSSESALEVVLPEMPASCYRDLLVGRHLPSRGRISDRIFASQMGRRAYRMH
jgi:glycosidase